MRQGAPTEYGYAFENQKHSRLWFNLNRCRLGLQDAKAALTEAITLPMRYAHLFESKSVVGWVPWSYIEFSLFTFVSVRP